jgi:hypothetical protein
VVDEKLQAIGDADAPRLSCNTVFKPLKRVAIVAGGTPIFMPIVLWSEELASLVIAIVGRAFRELFRDSQAHNCAHKKRDAAKANANTENNS